MEFETVVFLLTVLAFVSFIAVIYQIGEIYNSAKYRRNRHRKYYKIKSFQ